MEAANGAAARAGLRAGDCLLSVNGAPLVDALDLEFAAADGHLVVEAERASETLVAHLELEPGEEHGLELPGWLGDETRSCINECRFCFVDQMPPGLRPTLYVKDDDYRLSFLEGNFVTLTNMGERDLARIERLRLSPLFVSLHAWDDEARAALMGPAARASRRKLQRLLRAGIRAHVQIVLCPGWNDGAVLAESIAALAELDGVEDVGVVPVSVAQEGEVRRVGRQDAESAIELVERLHERLRDTAGRTFVHAADELYLMTGRMPPPSDAELQYENGIGMAAAFLADVRAAVADASRAHEALPPLALLCGRLAEPVIGAACRALAGLTPARPFVVENELFGAHVTVTGLLGGHEVLHALRTDPLSAEEWLLAPRSFLPAATGRTLDDVEEAALRHACSGRLAIGDGLREAMEPILA